MKKLTFIILWLFFSMTAYAVTVYKSVDQNGHITFSTSQTPNSIPVKIKQPKTIAPTLPIVKLVPKNNQQQASQETETQKVNTQVNQIMTLQQNINQASINLQTAQKNYQAASQKAADAKNAVQVAINAANVNHQKESINTAEIFNLSQRSVLADQAKEQAFQGLQQAQEKLRLAKENLVNLLQTQK